MIGNMRRRLAGIAVASLVAMAATFVSATPASAAAIGSCTVELTHDTPSTTSLWIRCTSGTYRGLLRCATYLPWKGGNWATAPNYSYVRVSCNPAQWTMDVA